MKQLYIGGKTAWLSWRVLLGLLLAVLCGGDCLAASAAAPLRIAGTGGALGAMKQLAAGFQKKYPGSSVQIIPHLGTRGGISGVLKGAIDIGLAGRQLNPQELAQGLQGTEYARSPFVFVTGSKQQLDLSHELIARIYRGEVMQWRDGTPIRPVLRPEGDVDILMLKAITPAITDAVSRAGSREGMTIALDDQQNCDLLEKIPGSFGTSTLTQIVAEKRALAMLPLNGVTPTIKTMIAGRYPHFKTFVMVTGPKSSPLARQFIAFVKSPEGGKILARTGNHVPRAH